MNAAAAILDRLARVKAGKPGSWMAACPCCESRRGRPLAVTETADGRVLIHAFCGCETGDVLARIGLELTDLFDQPLTAAVKPTAARVPAHEVLLALSHEANTVAMIASDLLSKADANQYARLAQAVQRISHASDYINERGR